MKRESLLIRRSVRSGQVPCSSSRPAHVFSIGCVLALLAACSTESDASTKVAMQSETPPLPAMFGVERPDLSDIEIKVESDPSVLPELKPAQPEAAPAQLAPVQLAPVQLAPVQLAPVQLAPVQPEPVQPEPVQPEPVQPEPVQPEPVQPEPVQAAPVQAAPVPPTAQNNLVQPEPVQSTPPAPAPAAVVVDNSQESGPALPPDFAATSTSRPEPATVAQAPAAPTPATPPPVQVAQAPTPTPAVPAEPALEEPRVLSSVGVQDEEFSAEVSIQTLGSIPPGPPDAGSGGDLPEDILPELTSEEGPTEATSIWEAIQQGQTSLRARYRFEGVNNDAQDPESAASTLRVALGFETLPLDNFWGFLESEVVVPIGNDLYNSTTNGRTERPVVADPESVEVNQAFVAYDGFENSQLRLGRQKIALDNERFIGSVSWRQNEQTYDGASWKYSTDNVDAFYAYLENANRIFGEDSAMANARMNSHLANASYDLGRGTLGAYWYYMDVDNVAAFSTTTTGVRWNGSEPIGDDTRIVYGAEYARQAGIENNPVDVDADYRFGEIGLGRGDFVIKAGFESLSGSTTPGDKFSTPFSTLHKFNGWADKFLVTPDTGLEDVHLKMTGKAAGGKWLAAYHIFSAEEGSADYGAELNLLYARKINDKMSWGTKFAAYQADEFSTDAQRVWLWLDVRF